MRESELLQHIFDSSGGLPEQVVIGPGDDMGAVSVGGQLLLVTTDQVVGGVHFDGQTASLERIARKSVTRNLSDVAAMAALPVAAVAAVCLPRTFGADRANELFDAMRAVAEAYRCPLIGGDISFHDEPLVITLTVLAEPAGIEPVRRNGAKAGDAICVSGQLGGAWDEQGGGAVHLDFEPRINLARKLASIEGLTLHSMIDLSDGLATDLGHICRASQVAAEIEVAKLPIRPHAEAAAKRDGRPAHVHALTDGEDYELCFTIDADEATKHLPADIDGVPLTVVGRVTEQNALQPLVHLRHSDGRIEPLDLAGWEHTA